MLRGRCQVGEEFTDVRNLVTQIIWRGVGVQEMSELGRRALRKQLQVHVFSPPQEIYWNAYGNHVSALEMCYRGICDLKMFPTVI